MTGSYVTTIEIGPEKNGLISQTDIFFSQDSDFVAKLALERLYKNAPDQMKVIGSIGALIKITDITEDVEKLSADEKVFL